MSSAIVTKHFLHHLPLHKPTYSLASKIQEHLVGLHLNYKRLTSPYSSRSSHHPQNFHPTQPPSPPPPLPIIITSEFHPPVYTTGRRQLHQVPQSQKHYLTGSSHPGTGERAEFIEALRGGQVTWHGRGQMTGYLVGDLKTLRAPGTGVVVGMGVREYVELLESVTIEVLNRWGVEGVVDEGYPGVWIGEGTDGNDGGGGRRKIAALGVHVRRNVVAHGVGVNVDTDLWWWDRIVACGIEGRGVTSLRREMERLGLVEMGRKVPSVEEMGGEWVAEMAKKLGRGVQIVTVEEVMGAGLEGR